MASKSPVPRDKDLYAKVKAATKRKFDVYPSIYANAWLVKEYKRRYEEKHGSTDAYEGKKNPKQGLPKWFKEQWVDLSRSNPDKDQWEECGRPDTGETQADWKRRYPKCLPKAKAKKLWKEGGKDAWKDAIERKRKAVNDPKYKGGKPTYVKTKAAETDGDERWGSSASGVLVVARDTGRILLGLRSAWVAEPGTWGNFGGAIGIDDDGQAEPALSPAENALKELVEETGYRGEIELFASWTYVEPNFRYYNFIGVVPTEASVPLDQTNWEVERLEWFTPAELRGLPNLHFGVSELMSHETELVSFSADYVPAFSPEPRFVKFRDLPKTTQWDITYNLLEKNPSLGEYRKIPADYLYTDLKTLDSLEFPVFTIPLSDVENVPGGRQSILAVMKYRKMLEQTDAPPILLTGEQFVDGIHRFLAYEMAHRYYIPALDLGNALTVDLREYLDTGKGDPIEWDVGKDSLLDFTFEAEDDAPSTLMTDWSELSPVELAGLTEFPSDDGHLDAWQMYISPSETREKYLEVLELAESEYSKMESEYREANGLKPRELIPWQDRKNLPFTWDEIYAKYFDFWYVPDCQYSLSGGGYHELSESIRESLGWDSLKNMAKERGIPFNESIPFDQYRSYYPEKRDSQWVENNIKWAKERGSDKIHVGSDLIIQALLDEHLSLPLEKIFYRPLLAAAPLDAEIGTDAGKGAGLIAGWHRDAYANILASQGRITGSPVVFFKPKEEFL